MNKTIGVIVGVLLVGIGGFYFGIKYEGNKSPATSGGTGRFAQTAGIGGVGGRGGRGGNAGGFVSGSILAKDETSITVKLRDGGSKIVFLSGTTPVMKMVAGALGDIVVGGEVSVMGTPNADGSVNAESVQIKPSLKMGQ